MKKIKIIDKYIGPESPCYVIAELGSNHDGKFEQAIQLIDIAVDAGVDAVKIQLPIASECYPPNTKFGGIYGDIDISSIIKKNEVPLEWIAKLVEYGHRQGVAIGASADGFIGLSMMLEGNVDFVKIPSFTISHIPLLKEAKNSSLPWLLSTGVHLLGEVEEALEAVGNTPTGLFHCISSYPTPLNELNLKNISFLKEYFNIPVGFSDHSLNPEMGPRIAVGLGADMIEKHFTIDRKLKGPDHAFALEPGELKKMVNSIRRMEMDFDYREKIMNSEESRALIGNVRQGIFDSEKEFKQRTRLGIYFLNKLKKGSIIKKEDIRVFRCADTVPGIHPRFLDLVVGTKLVKDCDFFEPVKWNHLLDRKGN